VPKRSKRAFRLRRKGKINQGKGEGDQQFFVNEECYVGIKERRLREMAAIINDTPGGGKSLRKRKRGPKLFDVCGQT